ncbi:DUF3261 domain-containing protein [Enterovibrio makurazakiensis]|uniref:DUF3261 domain-containing protein n=1 Tax=Enterovibrio makurazakiensis TaxID=2910232 RepID=UPI003D1B31F3
MKKIHILVGIIMLFGFTGCTSVPRGNQVNIAPNTTVTLPSPASFGATTSVSQLITANWNGETHTLPVQLQISENSVVLVGFSSWGTRILTLSYSENEIEEDTLAGLNAVLPDGRQVLLNIMLTLWPIESWIPHLSPIGWQLIERDDNRVLFNANGETIAEIKYDEPLLAGKIPDTIRFEQLRQDYHITINTLK